jgi:deoxyribonuclease (pyrimidine dimer)
MTRINCIPVEDLADQHLFIEYREITRVSKLSRGLLDYGKYALGEGHVKFFYDKGLYLSNRCERLYDELIIRGYNPTKKLYKPHPISLNDDWEPTKQDKITNLVRLSAKVVEKPTFYTLNKVKVKKDYYIQLLHNI